MRQKVGRIRARMCLRYSFEELGSRRARIPHTCAAAAQCARLRAKHLSNVLSKNSKFEIHDEVTEKPSLLARVVRAFAGAGRRDGVSWGLRAPNRDAKGGRERAVQFFSGGESSVPVVGEDESLP